MAWFAYRLFAFCSQRVIFNMVRPQLAGRVYAMIKISKDSELGQFLNRKKKPTTVFCPDCNREFHSLGWPRHRAMHRDKRLAAIVPTTQEKQDRQEIQRAIRGAVGSPFLTKGLS